jgi:hypothetical protein
MRARSSSTQSTANTSKPIVVNASASQVALLFKSSPRVSSVPMHKTAADMPQGYHARAAHSR